MAALSEWLQLMLAEIARKRAELESERAEQARRELESARNEPPARGADAADAVDKTAEGPAAQR